MKAELKGVHSPDADLTGVGSPVPDEILLVQLMIGPDDAPGEESFDVLLCTPEGYARAFGARDVNEPPEYTVIVDRIDIARLRRYVEDFLAGLEFPTWGELAAAIGRIGKWEFRDHRYSSDESE